MKRIFLIVSVLILFGVGAYYFFLQMTAEEPRRCENGFRFDPSIQNCVPVVKEEEKKGINLSDFDIKVPESNISFKLIQAPSSSVYSNVYTDSANPNMKGSVSIDSDDIVEISPELALVPLSLDSGGTGNFTYVALLDIKNNKHVSSLFVGDRISIEKIEIVNQLAKINYKTRTESQSYADMPTVPAQMIVMFENTGMSQIMKLQNSDYNQIEIKSPVSNQNVSGEFLLKGSIPGTWYFEAVAQFKIIDENSNEIAIGSIQSLSDWMTEQRVPFELKLNTANFNYKGKATIIIQSENTEGGLEGELKVKKIELPVVIK